MDMMQYSCQSQVVQVPMATTPVNSTALLNTVPGTPVHGIEYMNVGNGTNWCVAAPAAKLQFTLPCLVSPPSSPAVAALGQMMPVLPATPTTHAQNLQGQESSTEQTVLLPINMDTIFEPGYLESLVNTREGFRLLNDLFSSRNELLRAKLFQLFQEADTFYNLCGTTLGSAFLKVVLEECSDRELAIIFSLVVACPVELAENKFGCAVVQKSLQFLDQSDIAKMAHEFRGHVPTACTHQYTSHVIQKFIDCLPVSSFSFIINAIASSKEIFQSVVTNKYGCRVVEKAIEVLNSHQGSGSKTAKVLLQKIVSNVVEDCAMLVDDEYANYVVQQIIATEALTVYADSIIEKAILRNVLELSQAKFASHVVERALKFASPKSFHALMAEIFDGYEPDKDGNDALDILLLDVVGNYVAQAVLAVAIEVNSGTREGDSAWFTRMAAKVIRKQMSLQYFTSGRKIINRLQEVLGCWKDMEDLDAEEHDISSKTVIPAKFC